MQQKTAEIPPNKATPRSWLTTSCSINAHNCTINIYNCLINRKQSSLTVRGCSGSHCPGSVLPQKLGRDHNLGKQKWNIWILMKWESEILSKRWRSGLGKVFWQCQWSHGWQDALNALLFLKDDGENRRNQGKIRWEYPLEMKAGLMYELDQGFSPAGLNISQKGPKINQIFRGRTEICPESEGVVVVALAPGDEALSCPVLSFSSPGGCRNLTGSHWGLQVQSRSAKEQKGRKSNETSLMLAVPPFRAGTCHFPG